MERGKAMQSYIKIHQEDNVIVAITNIPKQTAIEVDGRWITVQQDIPQGHKIAIQEIETGECIRKYGHTIGYAKQTIAVGTWVHVHNLKTGLGDILEYTFNKTEHKLAEESKEAYFQGYRRNNNQVGIRNEIWIIPTVGCVNNVATAIANQAQQYRKGSVEEIVAFPHPYGCSQMGEDQEHTRHILANLIQHPNAGGVLVLGLGCENCNIQELKKYVGTYDQERIQFLEAQQCEDEVEEALEIIQNLIEIAHQDVRESISCRELIIGMKCGGSDGLSGITANPTVGVFSDKLIAKGGTTILTEVPEMFGAETILMNRCENEALFYKTVTLINDFKQYFMEHHQTIYENPSPGNKEGGISTLEDKSLGCTQKSGSAQVKGVLTYGECIKIPGLNLLSAPGNDLVAATALAAAGAHMVLFTTGRGTPFSSPVPTVKISTNTQLYEKKRNWIDFNCGTIVEGETTEASASKLFDYVLDVASGKKVRAEIEGYHDMAIWKQGITL